MSTGFFCSKGVEVGETGATAPAGAPVSPSLSTSHNCTEPLPKAWQILGGSHRRMAFVLAEEIILMAKKFGLENIGFLTLTFADQVREMKEAQRRFHSLSTHVLQERYERATANVERQASSRLHFHLVVVVGKDIRTGFKFEDLDKYEDLRRYQSANPALKAEWKFWRKTGPKYGFGRHELLPIKSSAEGIGRYVGKYVGKHIGQRDERDKGARLVRFIGYGPGDRKVSARFAWNSTGGWLWRAKVKVWAKSLGIDNEDVLKERCGPRWAWRFRGEIEATRIDGVLPSREAAERAFDMETPAGLARAEAYEILTGPGFMKTYLVDRSTVFKERRKTVTELQPL